MSDTVSTAMLVMRVIRMADLALTSLEQTSISVDDLVKMRAQAKREGRDNLSDPELKILAGKAQAAIDAI
jgi:hypothetical protein